MKKKNTIKGILYTSAKRSTRKNPLINYINFKIYFTDENSDFSINKLESILNIVYEKLKLKNFDSILSLNYFPKLYIENIESKCLYYSPKYNIFKLSKQRIAEYDKYNSARSLMHEIGHFVYYKLLTEKQRLIWNIYFNNTLKKVKIDTILKIIKKFSEEDIRLKYPLLYYNIVALETHKKTPAKVDVFDYEQLQKWKNLGGSWRQTTTFSKKPVSWYIAEAKIPEEAFAEVFAYYIYYGEKYILTDNVEIFKSLVFK